LRDRDAESIIKLSSDNITGIRNIRGEMNISPSLSLAVSIHSQEEPTRRTVEQYKDIIINLAQLKSLSVENTRQRPKSAATAVVDNAVIFVYLEGIIDFTQEINRLDKEIGKLTGELSIVSKKLSNEDFLGKAPNHVIEKVKEKQRNLMEKQRNLQTNLDKIKALEV